MANKGLLAVLLAAGVYLAGAAVSFCCIQTAMIASGAGNSSSSSSSAAAATTTPAAGCEPAGFHRLPVSLEVMKAIDAAVFAAAAAAWIPADGAIASMPFPLQRSVRNLAKSAFSFGALAPFASLPTCPAAPPAAAASGGSQRAGCGGPCSTFFSRAVRRRVNVGGVVVLAVASILTYFNLATWSVPHQD